MNLVLRQGRVIDPQQQLDGTFDVLIVDGLIRAVGPDLEIPSGNGGETREIDASGKWVVPGLIDVHVHLREPGEEYKETIASGTRAAAAGGFTAVACMPNTRPVNDTAAVTEFILKRAEEQGSCRVYPVAAISVGSKGEVLSEFGDLKAAGAVAFSDDGRPVMNAQLMRRALEYAKTYDMPIISHAEDLQLSAGGLMNEGRISTQLGLAGHPAAAEEVMVARDLILAEMTGGHLHVAHVSSAASIRMIRDAKQRGVRVTAETAPHYFTLTEEALQDYDTVYKVNPPLKRAEDVAAVREGLADGTLDAVATDHAPHSVLEKDTEFDLAANGMIGLETALPLVLELVREKVLTPAEAITRLSVNPARILAVPGGTLGPGSPGDVTVIDPETEWTIDASRFFSKSRNCPFQGRRVRGRAAMTLVEGRIVHSLGG